jgi:hypothetical protein
MQPDLLKKRVEAATFERCVIVCAYAEEVSPDHAYQIRDTLNSLDTDGWWFVNPGGFIVVFRSSRSARDRASACESVLARIAEDIPTLARLGIGSAEGDVLCSIASAGHLDTPPLGNVVNEAFWEARKNAS